MTDEAAKPAPAADVKAPGFWSTQVAGRVNAHGGGRQGMSGAFKQNMEDVKAIVGKGAEGSSRGMGFARVGAIGAGSVIALGAFKAKDAQGNDRGMVSRGGQALLGAGMIATGALAGRA